MFLGLFGANEAGLGRWCAHAGSAAGRWAARIGAGRAHGRRGAQGSAHAQRAQERRGRWGRRVVA